MGNSKIILIILILLTIIILKKYNYFTIDKFTDEIHYLTDLYEFKNMKDKSSITEDYTIEKIPKETLKLVKEKYLRFIVDAIIDEINIRTKLDFRFSEYEHVIKQKFNSGSTRYIIDFFMIEINQYYNRRMIIDITIENQEIKLNRIDISNGKLEGEPKDHPSQQFNSKIIDDENLKYNNKIIGVNDSKLEFSKTDIKNMIYPDRNFRKWIKHNEDVLRNNIWPCRLESNWWDTNGVMNTQLQTKGCRGVNTSYSYPTNTPKFQPNFKNRDINSDKNWLFGEHKVDGQHTI